ncbi:MULTISPECIES: hypothetical protein [Nocardia]|uniref:hypothetical protein n=1 Tax=Nocardia TaxID=1817 RepID=UPI00245846EF|nr:MULTISPECIES: hypothetical protein [Nocardia]
MTSVDDRTSGGQWGFPPLPAAVGDESWSADGEAGWLGWVHDAEAAPAASVGCEAVFDELAEQVGEGESRLAAVDDPIAELATQTRRRAAQAMRRRRAFERIASAAGTVAAVAVVGGGAWLALAGGQNSSAASKPAPTAVPAVETTPPSARTAAPAWCEEVQTPGRVVSASAGDRASAIGVILFQQYAWYELRDAEAVRSVLAADAVAASVEATRAAIATTPAGTRHCVTITPITGDRFSVHVAERHPDESEVSWDQVITTAQRDGAVVITSITAGDN